LVETVEGTINKFAEESRVEMLDLINPKRHPKLHDRIRQLKVINLVFGARSGVEQNAA
jgi:hypothetical protein